MLFRHSLLYLLARGLPGAVNFLAIAVYTRLLPPAEYGRYALVVAGVELFNVVFFQWLRLSVLRFLPGHSDHKSLLSTTLTSFAVLTLITGLMGLLLAWLWPDVAWRGFILLAIPLLWVQAWFDLNLELVRSRLQPVRYGLMNGVKAVIALAVGAAAVLWGLGAYGPLVGLLTGMLLSIILWGRQEWKGVALSPSANLLGELLRYGLPLTATFAFSYVVNTSDRFLIARALGEGPAGVYAAAYDLGQQTLTLLMMVVNLAAYPLVVRALEQKGLAAAREQLRQNVILLLGVAFPAAVGLAVLAPNVAHVLLGAGFRQETARVLPWVVMGILLSGIRAYHFDLAFQLGRQTMGQVWVIGAAALLNFALNLWWIPHRGLLGAAYATFVAYLLALVLSVVLGWKVFPVPFPFWDILKIALASLLMGLLLLPAVKYKGSYALVAQILVGGLTYGALGGLLNVGGYRTKLWRRLVT